MHQSIQKKTSELSSQVGGEGMALQTASGLLLLASPSRPSLSRLGSGSGCSRHFLSGCGLEQMLPQEQLEPSEPKWMGRRGSLGRQRLEATPHHLNPASSREVISQIDSARPASDASLSLWHRHGPLDWRSNLSASLPSEGLSKTGGRSPLPSFEG